LRRPAAGKALPDASSLKYFLQTYKQGTDSLNLLFTFLTGEKSALGQLSDSNVAIPNFLAMVLDTNVALG
jgi:hypothetical protein